MSRHFSKDCHRRLTQCYEISQYYNSDQKLMALVNGTFDQFYPNFKKYEMLSTTLRVETKCIDMTSSKLSKALFETVVVNDLQEYALITLLLRIEGCLFDMQLINLVDAIIQSCQDLHSRFKEYINECLGKRELHPGFKGGLKDHISIAHERHFAPYKAAFKKILDENKLLLSKYHENFNKIIDNDQISTYRIDFLSIMYESKVNINDFNPGRIENMLKRFKRLDSVLSKIEKADAPNARNFCGGLYLNAFQIIPNHHINEVELLKNEYFLKETSKAMAGLLALLSSEEKKIIAAKITSQNSEIFIKDYSPKDKDKISLRMIADFAKFLDHTLDEIITLIDINPVQLEKFTNFGTENDKLFTIENFLKSSFERSNNPASIIVSRTFREEWFIRHEHDITSESMEDEVEKEKTLMMISELVKRYFDIVMKSMHSLNTSYEKNKSKSKDIHFFLRTALLLRQSTEIFFYNQSSSSLCDSFSDYLLEENFTKNIDLTLKQENDFRLGYLFNSTIYKNSLRYEYFCFLSKAELENIRTFKKVERIAFKENNPLYLVMSFKSMESNLQDLFTKFKIASLRDIGIIQSKDFGLKPEKLYQLINENDEYAFFTSDKKHYDTKAPKTLMNFARTVPKTEIFDLVAIYISAIYDAICQCYSFCRNKKIQLARKFEAACMTSPDGTIQTEVISLLDESTFSSEQRIVNLTRVYEGLQKTFSNSSMKVICEAFKKDYAEEYSKVLINALAQSDTQAQEVAAPPVVIQMPATSQIEANSVKGKKKSQQVASIDQVVGNNQ